MESARPFKACGATSAMLFCLRGAPGRRMYAGAATDCVSVSPSVVEVGVCAALVLPCLY